MFDNDRINIDSYEEIIKYLEENNEFHDFRIGGFDYDSEQKRAKIFIEEPDQSKEYGHDDVLNSFYFELKEIEKFQFDTDLVLRSDVLECNETGEREITIALDNGHITFSAKNIVLSVPKSYVFK